MKYNKGEYIGDYKVLLPLKEKDGIETYRVRGSDGLLYALKYRARDCERNTAALSDLYVGSGSDYVLYRFVSGETLEARLLREHKCSSDDLKRFTVEMLTQLKKFHDAGYAHGNISESNVMIDLAGGEPVAWIIGLGSVTEANAEMISNDIRKVGCIMYNMAFGEIPETPPRIRAGATENLDQYLLNTIYKAIIADFSCVKEVLDAVEGRSEVVLRKPLGGGFSDVAGMQEIKKRLQEDVIDVLADTKGAKEYGIEIPNGMLLYGPPGCGKTFIAEKFAEQAAYNYQYVMSSDLASTYLHGTQEKIAALFNDARKNAPTILCFDEFDALVPRRDDVNNAGHSAEVNEFLSQLNNCGKDGVFVIATTNRPDKIDPAILRTGRIDYMVYVPIPDEEAREEMFRLILKRKPISEDLDYGYLAAKTDGYLTSDISAIVNDAARSAFRNKVKISMQILKNVLKTRMPSLSKESIEEYASLREKFENKNHENKYKRIGFK